jgi:hypothetical protein
VLLAVHFVGFVWVKLIMVAYLNISGGRICEAIKTSI